MKTDGVTLVENVLSDNHCRALLDGIEWGFQNRQGPFPMLRQRTYEWFREHPILMELLEHPLVIEVADIRYKRSLVGPIHEMDQLTVAEQRFRKERPSE